MLVLSVLARRGDALGDQYSGALLCGPSQGEHRRIGA
jgi:hypothetical protein